MTPKTTPRRATIIHGYAATPEDHWFGWLAARLEARGITTAVPALPDAEAPDPDRWSAAVAARVGTPDEGSALVAHSLGCVTALRHLRSLRGPWRLGALVLVSGFVDPLPALPALDPHVRGPLDLAGIRDHVDRLTVIRSDADPFVPPGHTDRLAGLLGTSAQVVPGAGHFLASDGVTSLPEALAAIAPPRPTEG
ncbi:alpha/beta hydrolase [Streptomyces sp. NPDC095602]|uniref:RBBP9/YdeN family alpha/beta hydrolase n=1 Tax=Streptomyces sp. NPDC095602 TaxID=3155819 RepID=UPI003321314C